MEITYGMYTTISTIASTEPIHYRDSLPGTQYFPIKTVDEIIRQMKDNGNEICRENMHLSNHVIDLLHSDTVYYALVDNEIIGTAWCCHSGKDLFITLMCTDASYKGVGTQLMNRMKRYVTEHSMESIRLDPVPYSEGFYKKMGFQRDNKYMTWTPEFN